MARDPMDRFNEKWVTAETGCHLWTAATSGRLPYGAFYPGFGPQGFKVPAHRWIYEQVHGPVPDGWEIDHLCKTRLCVNVAHLEAVPAAINEARNRLTLCRSGQHDLTDPANGDWDKFGRRRGCRPCRLERGRMRQQRIRDLTKEMG